MARKRLQFSGVYNTRPGTQVLSGVSGVVGIGIIGSMIVGFTNSGSRKDLRFINCVQITESDPLTKSSRLYVVDRPGYADSITPASGHVGNAIHVWSGQGTGGKIMTVFGNTNGTLYDSTTSKGSITGKARGIVETSVSGSATLLIASADSTGWYYQDGGSVTQISDGDFPSNTVGNFAALDGYAFIMDTRGRVWNSDVNSVTAWTGSSFVTANSQPDVGVGVVRHRNTLIGFCREHFDVFRNAGNPTLSPLSRVEELSQKVGCVSSDAITESVDVIYFAGGTKGHIGIYSYNGGTLNKVSNAEIDSFLIVAGATNISLTSETWYGRHFIVVNASSSTYVYCIEERNWHERTGPRLWYKCAGVSVAGTVVNYSISNVSTAGKVYTLNPSNVVYADSGTSISCVIQTPNWDDGSKLKKRFHRIGVVGDQPSTDQYLTVSYYDDDYLTASTGRQVNLASTKPELTRCGSARRRAFVLSHTAFGARLEGLELEYEVMSV